MIRKKKRWKKWMLASLLTGAVLTGACGQPFGKMQKSSLSASIANPCIGAWWGWLYPEFCFQELERDARNDEERNEVHFDLWLAQALGWW